MVNELSDTLASALELDNEVVVAGLGTFETKQKKERVMVNPSTGKKMLVPPKIVINFKMSSTYKSKIN
jgi:nucleoid DNA-binding protein